MQSAERDRPMGALLYIVGRATGLQVDTDRYRFCITVVVLLVGTILVQMDRSTFPAVIGLWGIVLGHWFAKMGGRDGGGQGGSGGSGGNSGSSGG